MSESLRVNMLRQRKKRTPCERGHHSWPLWYAGFIPGVSKVYCLRGCGAWKVAE